MKLSTNSNIYNNKNESKSALSTENKLQLVKRTRYSIVRFKNKNQLLVSKNNFIDLFNNNNIINKSNKRLTKYRTKNKTKYYLNNKSNDNSSKEKFSSSVVIGGIAYKLTKNRNKLTKKLSQKEVHKQSGTKSTHPLTTALPTLKTNKMIPNINNNNNSIKKCKILLVRGIKYEMDSNGKTLRQVSNGTHPNSINRRMSRLDIGGLTYRCSKPGLFVSTNAERVRELRNRAIKSSINRILLAQKNETNLKLKPKKHCIFFCRFGRCNQGVDCPYIHDKDKIAVCSRYIRGTCKAKECPFSHSVAPDKMPVCSYFLEGRCNSDSCPYRHVKVNSDAQICQDFIRGYCPKGNQFHRIGKCPNGNSCRLPHIRIGQSLQRNHKKTKRSPKSAKHLTDNCHESQNQCLPLPQFIPLSNENNCDNESILFDTNIDTNSSDLQTVNNKKEKYFWLESDDENSNHLISNSDNEEKSCRPAIRIVPKFLID